MALTRDFRKTIQVRALKDPAFRVGLLEESINEFLTGNLDTAKALLLDYINASMFQNGTYLRDEDDKKC